MLKTPTPLHAAGDRPLAPRWYIARFSGRHQETVSRNCSPVACDVRNRSLLYDVEEALSCMEALPSRTVSKPARRTTKESCTLMSAELCPDEPGTVRSSDIYGATSATRPARTPQFWDDLIDEPPSRGELAALIQWHAQLRRWGYEITPEIWRKMREDAREYATVDDKPTTDQIVTVYYLRVGQLIKIGQSSQLDKRLTAYPPHSVLLATEEGPWQLLERERHRQFASTLAHGREWFYPSMELIAHINTLREQPLTAADLAA